MHGTRAHDLRRSCQPYSPPRPLMRITSTCMQEGGAWRWLLASQKGRLRNWRSVMTWQVAAMLLLGYIALELALEGAALSVNWSQQSCSASMVANTSPLLEPFPPPTTWCSSERIHNPRQLTFSTHTSHACAHAGYPGSRSGEAAHVRRASRRAAVRRPRFVSCSLNCLKVRPRVAEFPSCLSNSSCIPSTLTTDPQFVGGDSVSSLGTVWTPNFGDIGIDVAFLCCRLELFTPE